jgi:D-alanyl-D-alanine carboxypeptidase
MKMKDRHQRLRTALLVGGAIALLAGCGAPKAPFAMENPPVASESRTQAPSQPAPKTAEPGGTAGDGPAVTTAAKPADIAVLVNKRIMLPADYRPSDLVEPNVPFIFKEKDEKRLMRQEAARALERMFEAAKHDGIYLAGVSGYRSYETQASLFNYYVKTQGAEVARKYSAEPGHSEHQTGLAMDVSGSTGKCAAEDCFADTPEAKWLEQHAPAFGFIIRYPKGKEQITGYNYEPWHLRYVGTAIATAMAAKGITLEEYYGLVE